MLDSQLNQLFCSRGAEPAGKFRTVARLTTFNDKGEFLTQFRMN